MSVARDLLGRAFDVPKELLSETLPPKADKPDRDNEESEPDKSKTERATEKKPGS